MKKFTLLYMFLITLMSMMGTKVQAQTTWDFNTGISTADKALLDADATNWYYDSSKDRYGCQIALTGSPLTAGGTELVYANGLKFTCGKASSSANGKVRLGNTDKRLELNGANIVVTIPSLKQGQTLTVVCQSGNSATARGLYTTNIAATSGSFNTATTEKVTNVGTVTADGDVTLTSTDGGINIFSIAVSAVSGGGDEGGGDTGSGDIIKNTVNKDLTVNQVALTLNAGDIKYYNTSALDNIGIDNATGKVTVATKDIETNDEYNSSVKHIGFTKAADQGGSGDITNKGVEITEAKGWNESAYVKWNLYNGATSYSVYIKGGSIADYTKLDASLVRNYGTYGRADAVGLKAGDGYAIKVVPIIDGAEDATKASEATNIAVSSYDRSGFAHLNHTGVGAYNDDGTLKDGAKVLYVSASTAKTVSTDVITSNNGATTTCKGLQTIIDAYQKGYDTTPLAIRLIGKVSKDDLDKTSSSEEGLQIKGKSIASTLNITLEGIGDDATIYGFGILARNAKDVEFRNFAIMLCMDDCVSIDTDNSNIWVHNLDLFYGNAGSASDQAKGDGTVDVKGDSKYVTISYNHLFDSGKSSLLGATKTSETAPNYIDLNHNWFDHSDSRHPRVRTMTVHVWNNYYDGVAKYGIGACMGSSVFVESNYFRATKDPMMISMQGTDAKGDGTFSGENGGMIKSFGNVYAEKGTSSNYTPITQKDNATSFDCYEATTRDEQVPSSFVALVGGTSYNNFDTNSNLIYSYTPDDAADVPAKVAGWYGAGRMNKGDFKYTFSSSADTNYTVDTTLKTKLQNYASTLVGVF